MIGNPNVQKMADRLIRERLPEWKIVEREFKRTRDREGRNRITLPRLEFLERESGEAA